MSDKLVVEIDVTQAQAALNDLKQTSATTGDALGKLPQQFEKGASQVDKLNASLAKTTAQTQALKSGGIDAVQQLSAAVSNIQSGNILDIAANFTMLTNAAMSVVPVLASVGRSIGTIGLAITNLSLGGVIAGFSSLGDILGSVGGRIASILTRFAALAAIAAAAVSLWKVVEMLGEVRDRLKDVAAAAEPTIKMLEAVSPSAAKAAEGLAALGKQLNLTKEATEALQQSAVANANVDYSGQIQKSVDALTKQRDLLVENRNANLAQLIAIDNVAKQTGVLTTVQKNQITTLKERIQAETDALTRINGVIASQTNYVSTSNAAVETQRKLAEQVKATSAAMGEGKTATENLVQSMTGIQGALPFWERFYNTIVNIPTKLGEIAQKTTGVGDAGKTAGANLEASSDTFRKLMNDTDGMANALKNADSATRSSIQSSLAQANTLKLSSDELTRNAEALKAQSAAAGEGLNPLQNMITELERKLQVEKGSATASQDVINALSAEKAGYESQVSAIQNRQNALEGSAQSMIAQAQAQREQAQMLEADAKRMFTNIDALSKLTAENEKYSASITGTAGKFADMSASATSLQSAVQGTSTGLNSFNDATQKSFELQKTALQGYQDQTNALKAMADAYRDAARAKAELDAGGKSGGTNSPSVNAPAQRSGGLAGNMSVTQIAPLSAWNNAPHFKNGGSTRNMAPTLPNGGIASVLHQGELVLPNNDSARVKVDMPQTDMPRALAAAMKPLADAVGFVGDRIGSLQQQESPVIRLELPKSDIATQRDAMSSRYKASPGLQQRQFVGENDNGEGDATAAPSTPARKTVNVNVNFKDLDKGQGLTDQQRALKTAKFLQHTIKQNA